MGEEGQTSAAMTGVQIKMAADAYIDETIDDPDALKAINRGLSIIGDMALIDETMEISAQAREWVELPSDVTYVVEVEDRRKRLYEQFRIRGNNWISFDHTGTYTVYYRRIPHQMAGILDTPEVHPAYHQALVTYVIAWWKLKDDDENPDGLRNMEQFNEDVLRVFNMLRRRTVPKTIFVMR